MDLLKPLNLRLALAFACFNLAYLVACYKLWCALLLVNGFFQLIYIYQSSFYISPKGRGVLITGCDSGFGHQLAQKLHVLGFTVFACCLNAKSTGALQLKHIGRETERLHVIQMDVTSQEDVDKARQFVDIHLPEQGLWGVVNNAGLANTMGFAEWCSVEAYENIAAVNLFGAIRVTNAFLPLIRRSHGRILNVTSILARITPVFGGGYSTTKIALEGFSSVLRLEMKRFNVKVIVIEPGLCMSATNITSGKEGFVQMAHDAWNRLDESIKKDYGKELFELQVEMGEMLTEHSARDTTPVVNGMVDALYKLHPEDRYFVGSLSDKITGYFHPMLPLSWSDSLTLSLETVIMRKLYPHRSLVFSLPLFLIALLLFADVFCR